MSTGISHRTSSGGIRLKDSPLEPDDFVRAARGVDARNITPPPAGAQWGIHLFGRGVVTYGD